MSDKAMWHYSPLAEKFLNSSSGMVTLALTMPDDALFCSYLCVSFSIFVG